MRQRAGIPHPRPPDRWNWVVAHPRFGVLARTYPGPMREAVIRRVTAVLATPTPHWYHGDVPPDAPGDFYSALVDVVFKAHPSHLAPRQQDIERIWAAMHRDVARNECRRPPEIQNVFLPSPRWQEWATTNPRGRRQLMAEGRAAEPDGYYYHESFLVSP